MDKANYIMLLESVTLCFDIEEQHPSGARLERLASSRAPVYSSCPMTRVVQEAEGVSSSQTCAIHDFQVLATCMSVYVCT